jgi:hypothetical protein
MMMKNLLTSRRFIEMSLLVFVFALGGCDRPPAAEMEAASEALIRAENDPDAVAFGETSLNRARDAVFRMRQEAADKNYDAAKSYAAEAVGAAEKAVNDGRAAAQRAREEAASLLATVKNSLAETEGLLSNARQNALSLDYDALNRDLEDARRTIDQAEAAVTARLREALDKGQAARAALSDIRLRISQGARAATTKK